MGTVRLLLALAVVFSHAGAFGIIPHYTPVFGYWPVDATVAVEMFYVVSGFLMGLVLTEKYQALDGWIWKFWLNRYSRLLPGYLVVLALSSILVSPQLLHLPNDTWQALLLKFNIVTMIGLEWPTFYSIGGHTAQAQVPVQQAWSLGIELMFYVVVPALSGWRTRTLIVLTAALVFVRLLIADAVPFVPWQQRLWPLELTFFLFGLLAHRAYARWFSDGAHPRGGIASMAVIAMLICLSGYGDELRGWTPINALFFTGVLAMAMPSIFAAMRDWRADRWVGEFSYPVYLVHMLVMNVGPGAREGFGAAAMLTLIAALPLVFCVEWPLERWRQRYFKPRLRTPLQPAEFSTPLIT
jgi:peptidoglycan/LPS O-acetylase OafA/YrhL